MNNDKDIELLSQDLIDVPVETGQYVGEPKKYYLVLKIAVSSLETCFLFIVFFNSYLMVNTRKVKLDELFGST